MFQVAEVSRNGWPGDRASLAKRLVKFTSGTCPTLSVRSPSLLQWNSSKIFHPRSMRSSYIDFTSEEYLAHLVYITSVQSTTIHQQGTDRLTKVLSSLSFSACLVPFRKRLKEAFFGRVFLRQRGHIPFPKENDPTRGA